MSAPARIGAGEAATGLPEIPVLDAPGEGWVLDVLRRETLRVHALLDEGSGRIPTAAIRVADRVSRRWLEKNGAPHLAELDAVAAQVGRPGAHYLNVSYEWGCTTRAAPSPDGRSARLVRVLDWPDRGLGRHVMAVRVHSEAGRWLSLTWPGYAGALQGVAPGRFAAALNQAPMDRVTGLLPLDWLAGRAKAWRRPHLPASYLLRRVFETATDFAEARARLIETPIAVSAIFTLAGLGPEETCVIHRRPDEASVADGPAVAANCWRHAGWDGRPRGEDNPARLAAMAEAGTDMDGRFPWLAPPILNERTRLALVADASDGALLARGYETEGPATALLSAAA